MFIDAAISTWDVSIPQPKLVVCGGRQILIAKALGVEGSGRALKLQTTTHRAAINHEGDRRAEVFSPSTLSIELNQEHPKVLELVGGSLRMRNPSQKDPLSLESRIYQNSPVAQDQSSRRQRSWLYHNHISLLPSAPRFYCHPACGWRWSKWCLSGRPWSKKSWWRGHWSRLDRRSNGNTWHWWRRCP
jgi:hypothetical protein